MVYSIKMVYTMVYHMARQQVKRHTMVNIMLYNIKKNNIPWYNICYIPYNRGIYHGIKKKVVYTMACYIPYTIQ